jgi:hypothetical protein
VKRGHSAARADPETKEFAAPYVAKAKSAYRFTTEEQRPWRTNYDEISTNYEALR